MKQILLSLLLLSQMGVAQKISGKISYEEAITFKIDFGEGTNEAILANFPESKKDNAELLFTDKESLYRFAQNSDTQNQGTQFFKGEDGAEIEIKMQRPDNYTYNNLEDNKVTEQTDFMGRTFLIKGELEAKKWKLIDATKEIIGYTCQKATYIEDSATYEAWYTTQIPYAIGPSKFVGLPGAILEVSVDDGERTYTAQSIDLETDYSEEIKAPKKGKPITREDFDKIKEEKLKEMAEEYGTGHGGKGVKVFIQKN